MKIDETLSILDSTLKDFLTTKIQVLTDQLPNLEYVILFGSYARIEQTIKSDIEHLELNESQRNQKRKQLRHLKNCDI